MVKCSGAVFTVRCEGTRGLTPEYWLELVVFHGNKVLTNVKHSSAAFLDRVFMVRTGHFEAMEYSLFATGWGSHTAAWWGVCRQAWHSGVCGQMWRCLRTGEAARSSQMQQQFGLV